MNEKCWFVRGIQIGDVYIGRLQYHSEGSLASVDFKWSEALGKSLLGFYHSHPGGVPCPSSRDDRTMRAWVKAEGRPMLCGIFSEGDQKCFLYYRTKTNEVWYKAMRSRIFSNFVIVRPE